jgi:glycosyltransferase involved in cell wall biosynthesis
MMWRIYTLTILCMDKIEFIIPTYSRLSHLVCLLGSLQAQSNPNWTAHIVADCPPEEIVENMKRAITFFNDPRFRLTVLAERHQDWGHTPRQYGLDNATETWVCMSGEDNYYVPEFVDRMLEEGKNHHFVYCDMVHNWTDRQYIPIKSELKYGLVDIGNFMCKTNMAQKIRLNPTIEQADFLFIEEFKKKFEHAKVKKVSGVLYVHN